METMDGYQRTALALRDMSRGDQEWFLLRLEQTEREHVMRRLRELSPPSATVDVSSIKAVAMETASPSGTPYAASAIDIADDETLATVLNQQPDWVAGVLFAEAAASPKLRRYLDQFPAERQKEIRRMAALPRGWIKPAVRAVVTSSITEQLQKMPLPVEPGNVFEKALARAKTESESAGEASRRAD